MKKHNFVPGQVASLEQRALLSGFKFPAAMGGGATLGFRGAHVLTSRAYENIQSQVNSAILSFNRSTINLFNQQRGFTEAFDGRVGVGTYGTGGNAWSYGRGTLLANLDARMASLEFKLPYGGGQGANNPTGGVGLSNRTAQTSANPALDADGYQSVAQLLEGAIYSSTSRSDLQANLERVRVQTLAFGNARSGGAPGILPSYVAAFGPAGARSFGLRNS